MENKKLIVTHSSKFHTDDVFAVATLLLVLEKEGKTADVVRTRDVEIIKKADYVVDVGGKYDEEKNLFDHHQVLGAGVRENGIPFASFGLVWKKYGNILSGNMDLANRIDQIIVQPVDAYDNGVKFTENKIEGLYPFDLRSIIYAFRPTWMEDDVNIDVVFMKLVSYAKILLVRQIKQVIDNQLAEKKVEMAYANSEDKRVIILDERYPWEEILAKFTEPLFVVYPKRVDNTWSLKTIRNDVMSYESRKDLPESWAGKFDKELEKITGVQDVVFCHKNRFLAVAKTKEAILKLALIALND